MMFNTQRPSGGNDRQTNTQTPLSPMAQNMWRDFKAATMSGREGSPKISLALLKGRASNQSVPSISFRFDPSAENLTQVSDQEEEDDEAPTDITSGLDAAAAGGGVTVGRAESLREASPVKETLNRVLGKRSSSLDSSAIPPEAIPPPPPPRSGDGGTGATAGAGGLLSRITKTFEDKINEIRKDKEGKENRERLCVSEGSTESEGGGSGGSGGGGGATGGTAGLSDRSPTCPAPRKDEDGPQTSDSPKTKTTLVQDITEHTSKFKSELGSIRPKLSELRQRRASKEAAAKVAKESKSGKEAKNKPSVFTSLLGRDEGLGEEMLLECDEGEVDRAEEATETTTAFLPTHTTASSVPTGLPDATIGKTAHGGGHSARKGTQTFRAQVFDVAGQVPITRPFLYKFLTALFIIAFVLPLPPFLGGLLVGVMVSGLATHCLLHFLAPSAPLSSGPAPDDGPVMLTLPVYEDKQLYKGWMNKLEGEYSPETYHVSLTHSVLLRLQGSRLKMDFPRGKVPKHARLHEEIRNLTFTHHLEYDLAGCQVLLLPKNLPRRWLWSRKYPICIHLQAWSKDSSPSPVSINSTPAGSAQGSPMHFASPGPPPSPPSELGRQGSSESGGDTTNTNTTNWSLENHHNRSSGEDDLMSSSLDMASFEEVTQDMCQEKSLILFARCDREKDDWFRRLVAASELPPNRPARPSPSHKPPQDTGDTILLEGIPDGPGRDHMQDQAPGTPPEMSFERYMARLLYQPATNSSATAASTHPSPAPPLAPAAPDLTSVAWINALAGRIFYDFLRNPFWANKVQERVQRKLSKLHVPYFVGDLVVCGVNMGSSTPQLHAAGTPHVNARGLWVDLKVEYSGNFTLSLETKLDLMKLKRSTVGLDAATHAVHSAHSLPPSPGEPAHPRVYTRSPSSDRLLRNLHFDTDTDDSVESSSEEEEEEDGGAAEAGPPTGGGGPTSRRLLKLVDTVAASRYFQHAAEWRLLQRALMGVSNTRIELSVEVRHLAGTLALNVPPPPTDRLWYGFRGAPELTMVARPRLGDRALSLPILVEFIQKQLKIVFEKVFVLPNMDDLVIPVMSPLLPGQHTPPRPPWETAAHPSTHGDAQSMPPPAFSPPTSAPRPTPQVLTPVVKFTPSSH